MKYFVVSDIHGYYDELIAALSEKGFDKNNPNHTLIVCGDCFDRGPKPIEVMDYLKSLPRRHLIWGNHEELMTDLLYRRYPASHDITNGTWDTLNKFLAKNNEKNTGSWEKTLSQFYEFFNLYKDYYETKHYIFVHSWIPVLPTRDDKVVYNENWRERTANWGQAIWVNPFRMGDSGFNRTGKTIVFGHYHCSYGHFIIDNKGRSGSEFQKDANWEPYFGEDKYGGKYIGIDACTAYTGKVNCIVIEDDEDDEIFM